jgi:hypothetical protein
MLVRSSPGGKLTTKRRIELLLFLLLHFQDFLHLLGTEVSSNVNLKKKRERRWRKEGRQKDSKDDVLTYCTQTLR